MSDTAADGDGPGGMILSGFFLKTVLFVAMLVVIGVVAPPLFPENEFLGVFVGMVWSIAFLIIAVAVIAIVGSAVRKAL